MVRPFSICGLVWLSLASVALAQGPGGWHGPGGYSGHGQYNGPQGSGVGWSGNWTGNNVGT